MPKIIQMPRRAKPLIAARKETPPQEGVTSLLVPSKAPEQDPKLQHYEKLAEIALSHPLDDEEIA